jgi:hypothetical protein
MQPEIQTSSFTISYLSENNGKRSILLYKHLVEPTWTGPGSVCSSASLDPEKFISILKMLQKDTEAQELDLRLKKWCSIQDPSYADTKSIFNGWSVTLDIPNTYRDEKLYFEKLNCEVQALEMGLQPINLDYDAYENKVMQSLANLVPFNFAENEYCSEIFTILDEFATQAYGKGSLDLIWLKDKIQNFTSKNVAVEPHDPRQFPFGVAGRADYLKLTVGDEVRQFIFVPGCKNPVILFCPTQ